jgi:tetratricopeptide (TPR) repeat protein
VEAVPFWGDYLLKAKRGCPAALCSNGGDGGRPSLDFDGRLGWETVSPIRLNEFSKIKWERARDLKRRGAFREAQEELRDALEEQPDHPLLQLSLADLYQRQDKLTEARVLTESVLSAHPENTRAFYVLGKIFSSEGRLEDALQCFQKASQKDQSSYLIREMARTLREMQRHKEALRIIEAALTGLGEDLSLLKEKALILNRMNRREEALTLYEKLHELAPEDRFVRREVYRLKGIERPREKVIKELKAVLNLPSRRDDPQLHGLLGQKLKEAGSLREAAEAFHKAWLLSNSDIFYLKQEGFCHYHLGDYGEAIRALGHVFRKDPNDYRIKSTLEKMYTATEDLKGYVDLLESILAEQPHHVKLVGVLKKFKKRLDVQKA